jgi:hypothetical protein
MAPPRVKTLPDPFKPLGPLIVFQGSELYQEPKNGGQHVELDL